MARFPQKGWIVLGTVTFLSLSPLILVAAKSPKPSYRFVTVDHPVDMWGKGTDKWAYYGLKSGKIEPTVEAARTELLALGFKEDPSMKPWFRFVKGGEEVVLCYHDQFEMNGTTLQRSSRPVSPGSPASDYICVLVKNGPGTDESLPVFQIKKLIHGW